MKKHQEKLQDLSVLPTLTLDDIQRQVEFVDKDIKHIGKVKSWWYDQPTNGITYVRVKASLKSVPEHLRVFVPMFTDLLSSIGTKNYKYNEFNDRILSCTNGLEVRMDRFSNSSNY